MEPEVRHIQALLRILILIWDQSSKILLGLCERIALQKSHAELDTLHAYIGARLLLLKIIPVRLPAC